MTNPKLTIALPDTHFPEQDEAAVACATKVVRELKPWRIVHLGDLLDGQPFSAHERSKMALTQGYDWLDMEVRPAQRWIDELLKYCDLFVLHEGNHEHRIERWANKNGDAGRALWGQIRPDHAILGGYNPKQVRWIPYVPDSDITGHYEIAPNLISIHGWSYAIAADRIHLQSAGIGGWSVIFGHTHRAQLATTRNPRTSELLQSWSPGCLSALAPVWTRANGPTRWSHGISLIYQSESKKRDWTAYSVPINRGRCVLPDGREFRV